MFHTIYPHRRKKTHGPASVGRSEAKWFDPNPERPRGTFEFHLVEYLGTGRTRVLAECRASRHSSAEMCFEEMGFDAFASNAEVVRLNWSFVQKRDENLKAMAA